MIDKIYEILVKIHDNNNTMPQIQLAKYVTTIYSIDFLLREKLIYSDLDESGDPLDIYHVDDRGYKYIIDHQTEMRRFWRSFFSQFITGLITGSVGTVVLERIIVMLLSGKL